MEPPVVKWSWLLRVLRWIDAHIFGAWQCRVCGCTDRFGCVTGCGWWPNLKGPLCTRCAEKDLGVALASREHDIAKIERSAW